MKTTRPNVDAQPRRSTSVPPSAHAWRGRLLYAFVWLVCMSPLHAETIDLTHQQQLLNNVAQHYRLGEYQDAVAAAEKLIAYQKQAFGRFDSGLIDPLRIQGEALYELAEFAEARSAFDEAAEIVRTNEGPYSPRLTDLLLRSARVNVNMRNFRDANRTYELIYEIAGREHGFHSTKTLPQLELLRNWYRVNRRYWSTAALCHRLLDIRTEELGEDDLRLLELKRQYVDGLQDALFPVPARKFSYHGFRTHIPGTPRRNRAATTPRTIYKLGQSMLNEVVTTIDGEPSMQPDDYIEALLRLADWEQIFRATHYATPLYREIWHALGSQPERRRELFAHPELLYIRLPPPIDKAPGQRVGYVDLRLTISKLGRVVGRKTEGTWPRNDDIEHYVRMAAKYARFRPAFKDGKPIRVRDYRLTHNYEIRTRRL